MAWHRAEVAVFGLVCFCFNADVAFGDGCCIRILLFMRLATLRVDVYVDRCYCRLMTN